MRSGTLCLVGLLAWSGSALAQEESPWSGTVAIVSDYVFRGVSQNDEDPALQASVTYTAPNGFYAGVWGSQVDFDPSGSDEVFGADVEIDLYVGYAWDFANDWSADVSAVYYLYPGTNNDIDLEYLEFIAKLSYRELLTASVGYSHDVFNSDETGVWYNLSGNWELPNEFGLHAGVGIYDFDDAVFDGDDSYFEWHLGIARSWGPVTVDVTYTDTDSDGEALFGELAEGRVVGSVTYAW